MPLVVQLDDGWQIVRMPSVAVSLSVATCTSGTWSRPLSWELSIAVATLVLTVASTTTSQFSDSEIAGWHIPDDRRDVDTAVDLAESVGESFGFGPAYVKFGEVLTYEESFGHVSRRPGG